MAISSLDFTSRWSPDNTVDLSYRYDIRDFRDDQGDYRTHVAALSYDRNVGRRKSVRVSYDYTDSEFLGAVGSAPSQSHSLHAGFSLVQRLSRSRGLTVSFGVGATHMVQRPTEGVALEAVAPTGFGRLGIDWAQTWSASVDYRRAFSTLSGLSAETFTTDTALIQAGGGLTRRAAVTFSLAYAEGQSSWRQGAAYDNYTGTSQLRLALSPQWSAIVGHTYYRYSLPVLESIVGNLPPRFTRNSIHAGLSFNGTVLGDRADRDRAGRN